MKKTLLALSALLILTGQGCTLSGIDSASSTPVGSVAPASEPDQHVDLSRLDGSNGLFRFFATLPAGWHAEYSSDAKALLIYDHINPQAKYTQDEAIIFINTFTAKSFLTLTTVDITKRSPTTIAGRSAMIYEITKKSTAPAFANQPAWRNEKHEVTDIRFTKNNPSIFYVIARNPKLSVDTFGTILNSLQFHNDPATFVPPLPDAKARLTKKPFGILINKQTSPVVPERFSGYHTAVDFEILDKHEFVTRIPVAAVCGGPVKKKEAKAGYGGVLIQECMINDQPITVIYGHLSWSKTKVKAGDYLSPGEEFTTLGESPKETDSERKHLHLGFHKGTAIEYRGYVATKSALSAWLDPCAYNVCGQ